MSSRPLTKRIKWLLQTTVVALIYCLVARLSLFLAYEKSNASPVWPPSGIAFAALLIFSIRLWPGVLAGAFWANVLVFCVNKVAHPLTVLIVSFFIGIGNTLEALLGVFLFRRFIGSRNPFDRVRDVFKFLAIVMTMSTVSAIIGPATLYFNHVISWQNFATVCFTWWLGDVTGILSLSPILLNWYKHRPIPWPRRRFVEAVVFLFVLAGVTLFIFGGKTHLSVAHYPVYYLIIPFIVWAALRLGKAGVGLSIFLIGSMAIAGTLHGFGPFAREIRNEALVLVQGFIGIITMTGLVLAAALNERQEIRKQLEFSKRQLSDFLENANVGLHWMGRDGRILWANQAELDFFGYSKEEYIGRHIADLHVNKNAVEEIMRRLLNKEAISNYEAKLRCKDGSVKYALISVNVLWENGQFIHSRCFTRDITEHKIAEENERRLKDQLALEKIKLEQVLSIEEGLAATTRLGRLIDFVVDKATEVLEAQKCSLMFFDEQTGEVCLKGHHGLDEEIILESQMQMTDPIAGEIIREGQAILVRNIEVGKWFQGKNKPLARIKSFMVAPIQLDHRLIGTLCVADKLSQNREFSEIDLKILCMITRQVAVAIESAKIYRELKYFSIVDSATQMYNYRYFVERLDHEIKRGKRNLKGTCLLMIDVDDFKSYADHLGYREGELLLKELGDVFRGSLRDIDIACRYASDQFAIIMPDTRLPEAKNVAEILKKNVADFLFQRKITLSIGVAQSIEGIDRYEFIQKANIALKEAKRSGKNRIYSFS